MPIDIQTAHDTGVTDSHNDNSQVTAANGNSVTTTMEHEVTRASCTNEVNKISQKIHPTSNVRNIVGGMTNGTMRTATTSTSSGNSRCENPSGNNSRSCSTNNMKNNNNNNNSGYVTMEPEQPSPSLTQQHHQQQRRRVHSNEQNDDAVSMILNQYFGAVDHTHTGRNYVNNPSHTSHHAATNATNVSITNAMSTTVRGEESSAHSLASNNNNTDAPQRQYHHPPSQQQHRPSMRNDSYHPPPRTSPQSQSQAFHHPHPQHRPPPAPPNMGNHAVRPPHYQHSNYAYYQNQQQQQQQQMPPSLPMHHEPQHPQQSQFQQYPMPPSQPPPPHRTGHQNHPPAGYHPASHPHQPSFANGNITNNHSGNSTAPPGTIFGLPPVPQSIQDFATLPCPNDPTQLPPLAVLEDDLVIYEYIAIRARTIADQLDASVTRIRDAIQTSKQMGGTVPLNRHNEADADQNTTATDGVSVPMTHTNYHFNNTSERSFSSASNNHSNVINNMMMNQSHPQGVMMNNNSDRSFGSRNSRNHLSNQFVATTHAQITEAIKNDMLYQNVNSSNEMMNRLALMINDHGNASNKHHKDHTIGSVIKNSTDGRNHANETIPNTIITAASPFEQQQQQHHSILKKPAPTSTNNPNVSVAASSFSVPLKLPPKASQQRAGSKSNKNNYEADRLLLLDNSSTNDRVRMKNTTLPTPTIRIPEHFKFSSVSLLSTSPGSGDGDIKPAASTGTKFENDEENDEDQNKGKQLKRLVSDDISKMTNIYGIDDTGGINVQETGILSQKAKELEKIKEEARILAQYAEFSRRVLEKKGLPSKADTMPKLQDDDENVITNTNVNTNDASSNVADSETTTQHVNTVMKALKNSEIETRLMELEKIKEQARQIASQTRKIIAEDVPEVLTTKRKHPYNTDELDVSSVSDPTMLLEAVQHPSQGDDIQASNPNDIHAIRDEARRIAQYTYQIIAGVGDGGGDISTSQIVAQSDVVLQGSISTSRSNISASMANRNEDLNPTQGVPSKTIPGEVAIVEDSEIVEDEVRILAQYEQYSQRMQKITNIVDKLDDVSQTAHSINALKEPGSNNSNVIVATREVPPLVMRNSLGEVISEERAKELARVKEEARLLALQVHRPSKCTKRLSNRSDKTFVPRSPEIDYVVNPDADRTRKNSATSTFEFVTWKDVLGDSDWATPNDVGVAADSVLICLAQFRPCRLRDDDRSGRYSHIEIGYIGICCNHCFGLAGYGRYFPTTLPSFISSFPSTVVKHILDDCNACPKLIKDTVNEVERVNQRSAPRCSTHANTKCLMNFVWESIRNTKPEDIDRYEESKRRRALQQAPFGHLSNYVTWEDLLGDCNIATIEDEAVVPRALLALWGQYEKCTANATDCSRTGRLTAHTIGYAGYCCRHCKGEPFTAGARVFPANVVALQFPDLIDKMYTHVTSVCISCPDRLRTVLFELQVNDHLSEAPRHGSKKEFFRRVWKRLHNTNDQEDDMASTDPESVQSTEQNKLHAEPDVDVQTIQELIKDSIIVTMDERELVTDAVLVAYGQLRPCRLEPMDKAGWYKDREVGFPGLCCKHCGGRPSSGRYFPKTGDNFLRSSKHSIFRHLTELCTKCPDAVQGVLHRLLQKDALKSDSRSQADEAALGAGKNFHHLLWVRLYKYYNVPHGYYEAIDYSLKTKMKSEPRSVPVNEKSTSPYVKKRKVEYGRSNPHRKANA